MPDDPTGTPAETGQPDSGSVSPTTAEAPVPDAGGQSAAVEKPDADDSFFDPQSIQDKPELVAAYKNMQRAFTKKMQAIKDRGSKADAYDAFNRDPIGSMQAMAQRLGYRLTRAEAAQQLNQPDGQPWEPKSWDDVLTRAKIEAKRELMQELSPIFGEVQAMKRTTIERQLNEIDPTWHEYEDAMKDNLREHPTLAKNPALLYRLSVPPEVLESRAVQRALKKMENKVKSSSVSGASTTKNKAAEEPDGPITFAQAVQLAKQRLESEGIRP